ncbi:Acetolactate synthase large subunit [subsurface metagenome]
MGEITGGELILKHLAQEKVTHIFGVPDFAYNPILGKLDKYGIRLITPRHEAAAAHMADAFYRASGQVAATLSGAGPGAYFTVTDLAKCRGLSGSFPRATAT